MEERRRGERNGRRGRRLCYGELAWDDSWSAINLIESSEETVGTVKAPSDIKYVPVCLIPRQKVLLAQL